MGDSDDDEAILEACRLVEAGQPSGPDNSDSGSDDDEAILEACRMIEKDPNPGRSVAQPNNVHRLMFGRYKGCTYEEVLRLDPTYCTWARSQANPSPMLRGFVEYLATA